MEKNPHLHTAECSCCGGNLHSNDISRRKFVGVTGKSFLGSVAFSGLTWSALSAIAPVQDFDLKRKAVVVKPILTYAVPSPGKQTSWREWGGIQTEKQAEEEKSKISGELGALMKRSDFPLEILPVSSVKSDAALDGVSDIASADVILIYAAGGSSKIFDRLNKSGKNILFFLRHRSGPVYLWYEIVSPRYLRSHTDKLAVSGITEHDVVVDNQDEILWKLRALCGLKNTMNSRILAIGGAGGWSQPKAPDYARDKFRLDIVTINYDDLGELIKQAKSDRQAIAGAAKRAAEYLSDTSLKLETKREYVENCFLLEDVFVRLMEKFECRALTINNCMSTIMPMSETTACLTLSLLNDAGYLAFCESDFVVIPAGILLAHISGKPVFLNDPTYPHDGIITLAHCTAPRRMDGLKREPARLLTHFESDYGAAPKVEMTPGQVLTNIIPDFEFRKNVGFTGKVHDNPFLDICRSQIDVSFTFESTVLAEKMPGFHWISGYGDYLKEYGYALRKTGIEFEKLS
ncbi:MAG TPA: hypothetical protein VK155_13605 [Bacteroidales bacterium]|nr:hypothetical protein [Bacteroidales bacterium]